MLIALLLSLQLPACTTTPAIAACDLKARLSIVADDSMQGRAAGSPGALKTQAYIERELRRLGVTPAGERGTYEQSIPTVVRRVGESRLDGFQLWRDYAPVPWPWRTPDANGAVVVFGGTLGDDAIDSSAAAGKHDANVAGELVALGAHLDHIGMAPVAVDHDSTRAANIARWASKGRVSSPGPADATSIVVTVRSSRDSIYNGADDDGSGTVALLEMAEALVAQPVKPRRSVLFVWHTAEELGDEGSRWLTAHPTVPLDSIMAQLNLDMIGRGSAADIAGGGPRYLQVIGSRRRSRELGDLIERRGRAAGFHIDYRYDAPDDPNAFYCRSDHALYAQHGIPIAFFTTGEHADYHQVTDEVAYIDYAHLARITRFVFAVVQALGNLPARLRLNDEPEPTSCASP